MSVVHESAVILNNSVENNQNVFGARACSKITLMNINLPTPPAFVIPTTAFQQFLNYKNGQGHWKAIIENCNPLSPEEIVATSRNLQKLILNHEFDPVLATTISNVYHVCLKSNWAHLTISPNPTTKAPVNYPLPVIKGESVLLDFLRQIWAAQMTPHALSLSTTERLYRTIDPASVIVSQFEPATTSGSITTIDPLTNDKNFIRIKAIWGTNPQSDPKSIEPDEYVVSKRTGMIISRSIMHQQSLITIDHFGHYKTIQVANNKREQPKLNDDEIEFLLKAAIKIQDHCLSPQTINWLAVNNEILFTRFSNYEFSEPIPHPVIMKHQKLQKTVIARGLSASPGIATAPVFHPSSSSNSLIGKIAVFNEVAISQLKQLKKAEGVVVETGGLTSEFVLLAREIGIPVLVGTGHINLRDNQIVTLDALRGELYLDTSQPLAQLVTAPSHNQKIHIVSAHSRTATKIYINSSALDDSGNNSYNDVDGVGLLRGSSIILDLDAHPKYIIKNHLKQFKDHLRNALQTISLQFGDRPIHYYPYDLDTSTASLLNHGKLYETTVEKNPLIGYRGAARIISDNEVFNVEIDCLTEARHTLNCKNIHLIVPMVRSVSEYVGVKRIVATHGLHQSPNFKINAELSTPAACNMIQRLKKEGVDGIYINLDHLTALTLGYDPDNAEVDQYLDNNHPAVLRLLASIVEESSKYELPVVVSSFQIEQHEDVVESIIKAGVNGITVSAQRFNPVKSWVQASELKIARSKHAHS